MTRHSTGEPGPEWATQHKAARPRGAESSHKKNCNAEGINGRPGRGRAGRAAGRACQSPGVDSRGAVPSRPPPPRTAARSLWPASNPPARSFWPPYCHTNSPMSQAGRGAPRFGSGGWWGRSRLDARAPTAARGGRQRAPGLVPHARQTQQTALSTEVRLKRVTAENRQRHKIPTLCGHRAQNGMVRSAIASLA